MGGCISKWPAADASPDNGYVHQILQREVSLDGDAALLAEPLQHYINESFKSATEADWENAINIIQYGVAFYPKEPAAHYHLAKIYYQMGEFEKANESNNNALKCDHKFDLAILLFFKLNTSKDGYDPEYEEILEEIRTQPSESEYDYLSKAELYKSVDDDPELAIRCLKALYNSKSENYKLIAAKEIADLYEKLYKAQPDESDYAQSLLEWRKKMVEEDSTWGHGFYELGNALCINTEYQNAIDAFTNYISLTDNILGYGHRAHAHLLLKQYDAARDDLSKIAEKMDTIQNIFATKAQNDNFKVLISVCNLPVSVTADDLHSEDLQYSNALLKQKETKYYEVMSHALSLGLNCHLIGTQVIIGDLLDLRQQIENFAFLTNPDRHLNHDMRDLMENVSKVALNHDGTTDITHHPHDSLNTSVCTIGDDDVFAESLQSLA